jgi:hypothetical protein
VHQRLSCNRRTARQQVQNMVGDQLAAPRLDSVRARRQTL